MPSNPRTMTAVFPVAPRAGPPQAAAARASAPGARRTKLATFARLLVERLPIHVRGRVEAEQAQHRGRDVHQRGVGAVDLAAREEDAGDEPGIDAVIAAPRLDVVLEHGAGDDAG